MKIISLSFLIAVHGLVACARSGKAASFPWASSRAFADPTSFSLLAPASRLSAAEANSLTAIRSALAIGAASYWARNMYFPGERHI
jgi:hypothetical protein